MAIKNEVLFKSLQNIAEREDFLTYVNTIDFEMEVLELSKEMDINTSENNLLIKELDDAIKQDKINYAFCLFFILFTKYRRNKMGNLLEFVDKYIHEFYQIKISEFIVLLAQFSENYDEKAYFRLLKRTDNLIKSKGDDHDFTNHQGILNLYVEIVCSYFESQLEDRFDEDLNKYINQAKEVVDKMIESCNGQVYPKYFLNKGRLLVLMQKYKEGERFIGMALRAIPLGAERERTVREYEQYLQKSNLIKSYDLTSTRIKELDAVKMNNTKALALMTTLLGFLLGTINIFAQVSDAFTLGMLMLCYLGLLLVLTGVVFLGLNLSFKETHRKFIIYDAIILILGVMIFATTISLVLKH